MSPNCAQANLKERIIIHCLLTESERGFCSVPFAYLEHDFQKATSRGSGSNFFA